MFWCIVVQILLFVYGTLPVAAQDEESHPVGDATGFQQNRNYLSQLPFGGSTQLRAR